MAVQNDDILKVRWQAKVLGVATRVQNVFHYKVADLVDPEDADIGTEFVTHIVSGYTAINAFFSSDYIAETLRITNASRKEFVSDNAPVFAGLGGAGATTPAQVAVEILGRARTLGHVARKYVGPMTEDTHTDGVLTAPALAAFIVFRNFFVNEFIGAVTGNTYLPVMVNYAVGGGVASFLPLDPDLGFVQQTARTMRSRIPGRGVT